MEQKIFKTELQMAEAAAELIEETLKENPKSQICIAAGHSSVPLFRELVRRFREGRLDFSQAYFTAMDEWSGMNETIPGSCGDLLVRELLSKVNFPPEHIRLVNGKAKDPQAECEALKAHVEAHGGFGLLVLGMGMNGHLALNEPGTSFSLSFHIGKLDEVTVRVGAKYFETAPQLTGGLTMGPQEIAHSKRVILLVSGERKKEILRRLLESPITEELPASFLKSLPQAALWYDTACAPF